MNKPAFRFSPGELSGALADLGVLLPLALALILLNGLNAASLFVGVGLAYIVSAFAYRLPIPVQPLKSFAATALALGLTAPVIAAGAWWMALVFLLLALSNAARLLEKLFPRPVVRGIQLGLSLLLGQSAWSLMFRPSPEWNGAILLAGFTIPLQAVLLVGSLLVLAVMLLVRRDWAALGVVLFGGALSLFHNRLGPVSFALSLPVSAQFPPAVDFWWAFWLLALPQIPLSLANSVFATADAARQYFDRQADHVTPRRLLSTMGVSNFAIALLGGMPVCHGCGGLTAHYRLGARTGGAPFVLGVIFLLLGMFGGLTLLPLLELIPFQALGVLLGYVAVQHALLARDLRGWKEWLPALVVAASALLTRNLAVGFAAGAVVYFAIQTTPNVSKGLFRRSS